MKRACIFCASSKHVSEEWKAETKRWVEKLHEAGYGVVYGGGSIGLMGAVADAATEFGMPIRAVIPRTFVESGWLDGRMTDVCLVDTLSERKEKMIDDSDVIIVLPGGSGTLDELAFAVEMKKLAMHHKHIIVGNFDHFYDHFVALFDRFLESKVINASHARLFEVVETAEEMIKIAESEADETRTLKDAVV